MQGSALRLPRPDWRVASTVAGLLLVLATCSSGSDAAGSASDSATLPLASLSALEAAASGPPADTSPPRIPDPGGAASTGDLDGRTADAARAPAPRQVSAAQPLPERVELHEPDLVVRAPQRPLTDDEGGIEGAEHVAEVGELTAVATAADGGTHELALLAADPVAFRPFTPEVTAQSVAVWQRLDDGDVLVRHDVGHELGLEPGDEVRLEGEGGRTTARVGALAANGAPPLADVVVPFEVAAELGAPGANALVVAARDDARELADALADRGEVELRHRPEPEEATSRPAGGSVEIEPFTYTSRGDGTIAIHGDWASRNIVRVDIPGMGTARCHEVMAPQLVGALQQVIDEGLYDHLEPGQYGGCWVPRHILFDPDRSLSMHAWGLAIDFNVHDNAYGARPQMNERIVEIFEAWGFSWGGHWSTPDGMHFELERVVRAAG